MGEAKRRMTAFQSGSQSGAKPGHIGLSKESPPSTNRGGNGETGESRENDRSGQSGTDRYRVNVSLPFGIHQAVNGAAEKLGASVSQIALMAIMAGMPEIQRQIEAAKRLTF